MADTPLGSGSVDAAVFSLALMGLDYGAFLVEAARVLKQNGWLWIAEVSSSGIELSAEGSPGCVTVSLLEAARAAGCGLPS
jgi:ubiquinone/menaquinone biosynthesis C-methylase UbiE